MIQQQGINLREGSQGQLEEADQLPSTVPDYMG
jgi:hypothetical protein